MSDDIEPLVMDLWRTVDRLGRLPDADFRALEKHLPTLKESGASLAALIIRVRNLQREAA